MFCISFLWEVWKCHSESLKWSFTAGWGCCEGGHGIFSHLREPIGQVLWVSTLRWALQWLEAFSQREGGWVGLKYMFQFPEWDGSIFPCPLTVFVGKNREAQHEFMLCIWWYQIISFWSVSFYLGWGEGVCTKDLKMLQTLFSLQMTDRTQTWADGCLASFS